MVHEQVQLNAVSLSKFGPVLLDITLLDRTFCPDIDGRTYFDIPTASSA